jgi:pyridoxamine 5'-phosphate oxidase
MTASAPDPPIAAAADPFILFDQWFAEAGRHEPGLPEAMSLATVGAGGHPSLRLVLMKEFGPAGIVFYSNAESRKGRELATNAAGAVCFHWKSLARQVRAEGRFAPVDAATADAYFRSRPRASQISAWASDQSRVLSDRGTLIARFATNEKKFAGRDVPRPAHWIGWRMSPEVIEFWQDVPDRMHDRLVYVRNASGWRTERLFP